MCNLQEPRFLQHLLHCCGDIPSCYRTCLLADFCASPTQRRYLSFLLKKLTIFHSHTYVVDDVFGHGWFRAFLIINAFGVNSLIALIEVLSLSSIRRQEVSRNAPRDFPPAYVLTADLGTRRWPYCSLPYLHRMGIHRETLYWRLCVLLLRLQSDRLGARYYRDSFILRSL
jgi:hypothetical protein